MCVQHGEEMGERRGWVVKKGLGWGEKGGVKKGFRMGREREGGC